MPVPVALRAALLLLFTVIIVTIAPLAARAQTATDIGPPPPTRFVPSEVVEEARRDAEKRQARAAEETKAADELGQLGSSALAAGDSRSAADYFRRAIALAKDDPAPWIGLARAKLAIAPADGNETYALPREATSAALAAYGLTRTAALRAESLAVLAQALERRELYRPALEAYKASLALAESAPVRQAFSSSRRARASASSTTPSTPTPGRRASASSSRTIWSSPASITPPTSPSTASRRGASSKDDRQICVDGLNHGQRYQLALRQGLPAAIGEIARGAGHARGLCPRSRRGVRFTGDNFVLPSSGAPGIPVVTVNAREVKLTLYRIGDRALARLISDGKFLHQLDGYDADSIRRRAASRSGRARSTRGSTSTRRSRPFPVDEALPERKPGVYVLIAGRATDKPRTGRAAPRSGSSSPTSACRPIPARTGSTCFARSLDTAKPLAGVDLTLLARNNEILGTAQTDADGRARFDAGPDRAATAAMAPAAVAGQRRGG